MMGLCKSELATRPLLYTDSIKGAQVCRDDMWAVTTEELNRQADRIRELESELAALRKQQGEPVAWIYAEDQGRGHRFMSELPPTSHHPQELADAEVVVTPLYREVAPRVPEGWQKTPSEIISEAISAVALEYPDEWLSVTATFRQNTSGIGVIDDLCILVAAPEPKE